MEPITNPQGHKNCEQNPDNTFDDIWWGCIPYLEAKIWTIAAGILSREELELFLNGDHSVIVAEVVDRIVVFTLVLDLSSRALVQKVVFIWKLPPMKLLIYHQFRNFNRPCLRVSVQLHLFLWNYKFSYLYLRWNVITSLSVGALLLCCIIVPYHVWINKLS